VLCASCSELGLVLICSRLLSCCSKGRWQRLLGEQGETADLAGCSSFWNCAFACSFREGFYSFDVGCFSLVDIFTLDGFEGCTKSGAGAASDDGVLILSGDCLTGAFCRGFCICHCGFLSSPAGPVRRARYLKLSDNSRSKSSLSFLIEGFEDLFCLF